MNNLFAPRNHFIFGSVEDGEEFRYLVLDIFTKNVYIGKEENGFVNPVEKLTPGKYMSMINKGKHIDMLEGTLVPYEKNDSMLAAIKGINFEHAIPKNFPVE